MISREKSCCTLMVSAVLAFGGAVLTMIGNAGPSKDGGIFNIIGPIILGICTFGIILGCCFLLISYKGSSNSQCTTLYISTNQKRRQTVPMANSRNNHPPPQQQGSYPPPQPQGDYPPPPQMAPYPPPSGYPATQQQAYYPQKASSFQPPPSYTEVIESKNNIERLPTAPIEIDN